MLGGREILHRDPSYQEGCSEVPGSCLLQLSFPAAPLKASFVRGCTEACCTWEVPRPIWLCGSLPSHHLRTRPVTRQHSSPLTACWLRSSKQQEKSVGEKGQLKKHILTLKSMPKKHSLAIDSEPVKEICPAPKIRAKGLKKSQ